MFTHDPNYVLRDFVTDGIPASGRHEVPKSTFRALLTEFQQILVALVAQNPGLALPNLLIRYSITGGTANAIVAQANLPIPDGVGLALYSIIIEEENTGAVTINGKPLKLRSGDDLPSGYLTPGPLLFIDAGDQFQVLSYGDAEAAQAAAEAALADLLDRYLGAHVDDAAATAAAGTPVEGQLYWNTTDDHLKVWNGVGWVATTQAAGTITSGSDVGDGVETDFTLPADAEMGNTFIYVDGRRITSGYTLSAGALSFSEAVGEDVPIDWDVFDVVPLGATTASLVSVNGGQTLQQKLDALDDDILLAGQFVSPDAYGAAGDGTTDDTDELQAMFDDAPAGSVIYLGGKTWKYTTLTIDKAFTIWNGHLASDMNTNGAQITVDKDARVTWIDVELSGGGSNSTAVLAHDIIRQIGTSSTDRAVGQRFYRCTVHGAGLYGLFTQWADDTILEDCHFYDCAYSCVTMLSPRRFRVRGGLYDMLGAVGSGPPNAYGIAMTHDSSAYDDDPLAGTPRAENHFPIDCIVDGATFYGPEIWEAIDFHGGYQCKIINNHVYASKHAIMAGNSSGDAANYAGYQNIIANNVVDVRLPDGTASGVTPGYGITVQGGSVGNSWQIQVTGNVVRGYGNATPNTDSVSILVNAYVDQAIISGNIISNWTGYGIYVANSNTLEINGNMFSRMGASSGGDSSCVYMASDYAARAIVAGNVLDPGGNQPVFGLRVAGTSASVSYASDFRSAGTEYSDASANGRSAWS